MDLFFFLYLTFNKWFEKIYFRSDLRKMSLEKDCYLAIEYSELKGSLDLGFVSMYHP